jgi:two-component system, NarL family, response regulator DevR
MGHGPQRPSEPRFRRRVTMSGGEGEVRVFLLDDHEMVRRGLKDLFDSHPDIEIVGESGSAKDAEARIPALRPDVALLDARLPDGSGVEVCRAIRSVDPSINAIILTSYDDDEALFAAIMAGASGYILKQIVGVDLIDVVRKVANGQSMLDSSVTQRVLERVRSGGPSEPAELRSLTPQERRILELVTEGMTNRQIGEQLFLAEKTVKNYVTSILSKLGMQRRTQAAVLASKLLS